MWRRIRFLAVALGHLIPFVSNPYSAWSAGSAELLKPTHKQTRVIRPVMDGDEWHLNTFAMSADGQLWMCCSKGNPYAAAMKTDETGAPTTPGKILIYDADGTFDRAIDVPFIPQAFNFSPSGVPFVAGSGKVACLTASGEVDKIVDAPNLDASPEMKEKWKKQMEDMLKRSRDMRKSSLETIERQIQSLEKQLAKYEEDKADQRQLDRTKTRIEFMKKQLKQQTDSLNDSEKQSEQALSGEAAVAQLKKATGLAVTHADVFVSLPSPGGDGYAVYRMTHELTDPQIVKDEVRGCCGQLDIQSDGEHLVIAQNCDFKVGSFDRDGKLIRDFGKRGQSLTGGKSDPDGWGSCCNPMNIRCLGTNEILVAESSIGHIKRYTSEGEFLGIVGTAKIGGGCKHVAVARALNHDWYFMMNTTANNIAVLVPLAEAPTETDDERESRLAMQGLGQKLLGSWKLEKRTDKVDEPTDKSLQEQLSSGEFDYVKYVIDQNKFLNLQADGKLSRVEPVASTDNSKSSVEPKSAGFFGTLANLLGISSGTSKDRSNSLVPASDETMRWQAVKQDQDIIQFVLFESEVRSQAVAVRFIDEKTAEFKWYYDDVVGEPLAVTRYVKVAGCAEGTCPTTPCDKSIMP